MSREYAESYDAQDQNLRSKLRSVYNLIRAHRMVEAQSIVEKMQMANFDDPDLLQLSKHIRFWRERDKAMESMGSGFEKAEYLMAQWERFSRFSERVGFAEEEMHQALAVNCFQKAIDYYRSSGADDDPRTLYSIGLGSKKMGSYNEALAHFDSANQLRPNHAPTLAHLGDCLLLLGEEIKGKLFLKEAFYQSAASVPLEELLAGGIQQLTRTMEEEYSVPRELLNEWFPVYGTALGLLNVLRDFKASEYGILKQDVVNLERDVEEHKAIPGDKRIPRLIFKYMLLIEQYQQQGEARPKINELFLRIRALDEGLFKLYTR